MKIEIKYYVDSQEFSDQMFEDEPERTFIIDENILSDILRIKGSLKLNETLHEFEAEIKI